MQHLKFGIFTASVLLCMGTTILSRADGWSASPYSVVDGSEVIIRTLNGNPTASPNISADKSDPDAYVWAITAQQDGILL